MEGNQTKRGVYAPDYYKEFKCIADKCRHSCCIDWEICIDEETLCKYKKTEGIMDTVTECEGDTCFVLSEDGRCPHLNEDGLCKIIISYGEDYLSEICRNHPRFFNDVGGGRVEAGLGIVCEEACRLILDNENPFSLSKIEEAEAFEDASKDFDYLHVRDNIIELIQESENSFDETVEILRERFDIPEIEADDERVDLFLSLEILDDEWPLLLNSVKGKKEFKENLYEKYYKRLLAYFVYRHVSTAETCDNLRARLAFAFLSVKMIRRLFEANKDKSPEILIDIARRYSAEIEYSEDNTDELILEFESII